MMYINRKELNINEDEDFYAKRSPRDKKPSCERQMRGNKKEMISQNQNPCSN